jgi:type IV pilus assembly protein PilW
MDIIAQKANVKRPGMQSGFTLIEIIVAMAVAAVVIAAMTTAYQQLQQNSTRQAELSNVQMNLRGVFAIMEREFRMIGRDGNRSNRAIPVFGVTDVRRFDITQPGSDAVPDLTGSPILRMTADLNNDGNLDADETVTYLLYDKDGDGTLFDMARSTTIIGADVVSGRQLLAEGIEALGFAFAFDNDGDGAIDRTVPAPGEDEGNIIWAIDSNNDNRLDATPIGNPLGYTVPVGAILAVQVSVLARAKHQDVKFVDTDSYSIGHQLIVPDLTNNHFRRWRLTEILYRRNR